MRTRPTFTAVATVLLLLLGFVPVLGFVPGSVGPARAAAPTPDLDLRTAHGQDLRAAEESVQAPIRIMPLGDSITGSPGCWRALLWQSLQEAGYTAVDFVGTQQPQGCGFPYDGEHEGHGGALVTTVADQNQLVEWLAASRPDVVLMHFGTNDVWSDRSTETILAAYTKLVDQMRDSNPTMTILVAQIIPMDPSNCAACGQRVVDLNAAIPGWAAEVTTERSPVIVVDQWSGFDTATDTYDGVHPNATGDRKMADAWFAALVEQVLPGRG